MYFTFSVDAGLEFCQIPEIQAEQENMSGWTSKYLIGGIIVFIPNPAIHALVLIEATCSPQFLASLMLTNCTTVNDKSERFEIVVPLFLLETVLVTAVLYQFTFNWTIIVLGMSWIRQELLKIR